MTIDSREIVACPSYTLFVLAASTHCNHIA